MQTRSVIIVSGIVQGVNYRRFTQMQARLLDVCGWVRNLADGRVEGCFEGEATAVAALVEWCRNGPPSGRVDDLAIRTEPYTGEFTDFTIKY